MIEIELLLDCGLSERQAKTYLALIKLGATTVSPLAKSAGVKRTSIYNFINELIDLGIIGKIKQRGRWLYFAEPPERLLHLQRARFQKLEQAMPHLNRLYQAKQKRPSVLYYEGPKEMRNIIREELNCKSEALYNWPAKDVVGVLGGPKYLSEIDKLRVKKGISVRSIHFRDKGVTFETSAAGKRYLREVRYAPVGIEITLGIGIYDSGKVGIFGSHNDAFGVVIESQEFFSLMRIMYSYFWARCEEVTKP